MKYTYMPSSNTSTNGVALSDTAGRDVTLMKLVVGAPVSAGNIVVYDITNPVNGATTNIAVKITLPSFSSTNVNPGVYVIDFGPKGLTLGSGGAIIIDQTMQVTAMWQYLDERDL